jgi:hypothetical protein
MESGIGKRRTDVLAAVTVDHVNPVGRELLRALDDVRDHRPPRERLEDLRDFRPHAFAEPGGKDNDG